MKKNTSTLLLFFALAIGLVACNKSMMTADREALMYKYGIRDPEIESKESILVYARSIQIDTDNIYAYSDSTTHSEVFKSKLGQPELDFYNKDGYLMNYRKQNKCNAQNVGLIQSLRSNKNITVDSSKNIFGYISKLRTLDNKDISRDEFKDYDYYMVIYWSKWVGMADGTHVPMWEKEAKKKTGLRIKVIAVTGDYMEYWHPSKKSMVKIYSEIFMAGK